MQEWLAMDHEERLVGYGAKFAAIERTLAGVPSVTTEVRRYDNHYQMGLHVTLDSAAPVKDAHHLADKLLEGSPSIRVRVEGDDSIAIIAHTINDGEEHIIANRMGELLNA
jgi:hypothetical protein